MKPAGQTHVARWGHVPISFLVLSWSFFDVASLESRVLGSVSYFWVVVAVWWFSHGGFWPWLLRSSFLFCCLVVVVWFFFFVRFVIRR